MACTAIPRPATRAGFTLIEVLLGMALVCLLATLAYPAFDAQLRKVRRAEAISALLALELAQGRWRGSQPRYASALGDLDPAVAPGTSSTRTPSGRYLLEIRHADADGYLVQATALASQARDSACRHLGIRVRHAMTLYLAGSTDRLEGDQAAAQRCWGA